MAQLSQQIINLSDLDLDLDNYRIGRQSTQKDAIKALIEDQEDKLSNLAEDILDNGLSPLERMMVYRSQSDQSKFIVVEGNRRLLAMKLVREPRLARETAVENAFKKLHKRLKELPKSVDCAIFPDKQSGYLWIERKHEKGLKGKGTEEWTSLAKIRAEADQGKSAPLHGVLEFVISKGALSDDVRGRISGRHFNATNLERILDSPDVRKSLGIQFGERFFTSTADRNWTLNILSDIVEVVATGKHNGTKWNVDNIRTKDQQVRFVQELQQTRPKPSSLEIPWTVDANADLTSSASTKAAFSTPKKKLTPKSADRKRLVPLSCGITIPHGRANDIFVELRKLEADKFENAVSVLFRVFIEFGADNYNTRHKISGYDPGKQLVNKLKLISEDMELRKVMDVKALHPVRKMTSDPNSIVSTMTLNAYVHNPKLFPSPQELKVSWDRLQDFIQHLWQS